MHFAGGDCKAAIRRDPLCAQRGEHIPRDLGIYNLRGCVNAVAYVVNFVGLNRHSVVTELDRGLRGRDLTRDCVVRYRSLNRLQNDRGLGKPVMTFPLMVVVVLGEVT